MSEAVRLYQFRSLLSAKRALSAAELMANLEISPATLERDNAKLRDDLRSFNIDAIAQLRVLDNAAKEVSARTIEETMGVSYGIFGGRPQAWAKLRFTKERARWVERETWHPQQESHTEPDGSYVLSVPYSDDREIMGDVMRFGAVVEVLEPKGLRKRVQKGFLEAAGRYV
ncbi:MAG: WYL domain-containing protein [Rhodoferax sp.]|nr:WYL domain-containing protein [Rhodoferax sp.]